MWSLYILATLCYSALCQNSEAETWLNSIVKEDNELKNSADRIVGPTRPRDSTQNYGSVRCTIAGTENGFCVRRSHCASLEDKEIDPASYSYMLRRKNECHWLYVCCPSDKLVEVKRPEVPAKRCGWSNAQNFTVKTDNGFTDYSEFPWMVAMIKKNAPSNWQESYIGGGSLIHPSVVLTAAHKFADVKPDEVKCRAGEWDLQTELEFYPHQERDVKKILVHRDHVSLMAYNDVALLILKNAFSLADAPHIGLACLGNVLPAPGTKCYTMGWLGDKQTNSVILKKVEMPLLSTSNCEEKLRRTRLGTKYTLHSSQLCAGEDHDTNACVKDTGSPLVCAIEEQYGLRRYAVFGIMSYGIECGIADIPDVFVSIPEVYDWIWAQFVVEGLDSDTYKQSEQLDTIR